MTIRGRYKPRKRPTNPTNLGERIKAVRLAWGWTQAEMAAHLLSDQSAVSGWERGRARPAGAGLTALCTLFGLSREALMEGTGFTVPEAPQISREAKETEVLYAFAHDSDSQADEEGVDSGPAAPLLLDRKENVRRPFDPAEAASLIQNAMHNGKRVWLVMD